MSRKIKPGPPEEVVVSVRLSPEDQKKAFSIMMKVPEIKTLDQALIWALSQQASPRLWFPAYAEPARKVTVKLKGIFEEAEGRQLTPGKAPRAGKM
jgi:hypothetical protein